MKRILLSLLCLLGITMCWAQVKHKTKRVDIAPGKSVIKNVYEMDDEGVVWPKFPGGGDSLKTFLISNIKYPLEAEKNGIQGKVLCTFVVTENGSVIEAEIKEGVDPLLDEEAMRVIGIMPNWIPGTKDGFPINVRFTLPVTFRLDFPEVNSDSLAEVVQREIAEGEFVLPSFPGGLDSMLVYIDKNLQYPEKAIAEKIEGQVVCGFLVEKDGSISMVDVLQSVSKELDNEAVRLISNMPRWQPAHRGNENVAMLMSHPIMFQLPDSLQDELIPASFPGGRDALIAYLQEKLQYPGRAKKNGIQGRVVCTFFVETDGSIEDVRVLQGVSEELDEEAVRVIEVMPKWEPARRGDKKVRISYTLPITFKL